MGITVAADDKASASLINSMSQSGVIGDLPDPATVIAGSFYFDTTNSVLKQEQGGGWVDILAIQTLDPANETVATGYYAATTLSAVDTDLAVGNIKKNVVIFGFTGTYLPPLIEDVLGSAIYIAGNTSGFFGRDIAIGAGADGVLATKDLTYASNSRTVAVGSANIRAALASIMKLRLYMAGVEVAESGYYGNGVGNTLVLVYTEALEGLETCYIAVHNYDGSSQSAFIGGGHNSGGDLSTVIGIGSVKVTL